MKGQNHTDIRARRIGELCRLATINVKSAGKPGALFELEAHITENGADVTAIQEPYLPHGTPHELVQGNSLIVAAQSKTAWAVARTFLEGKTWAAVNLSDRVSALRVSEMKLLLVNIYAPAATKANTKAVRIHFWETLPGLVKGVKEDGDHVCLMGDFNVAFPPWLAELWGHTVDASNAWRDTTLSKDQEDVATAALTAMTKMDVALTTWQGVLEKGYHTYESENLGENGVRTTIDHMAMTGSLLPHVEGMRAIWPRNGTFTTTKPDHAFVTTQVVVHGENRKSRRHQPEPPPFPPPPLQTHI